MNGEKGYHFFSTLIWRNWTVTAAFSGDDQDSADILGPHHLQRPRNPNNDERNFVDAAYERPMAGGTLRWRTYYDSFHYKGRGDYAAQRRRRGR